MVNSVSALHCERENAFESDKSSSRRGRLTNPSSMDSPPPEKSEYEIARDWNVAEVRKKAAACEAAAREW